ncbi:MAG: signal peptidase II [Bryobacteraceae bacterium]
MPSRALLFGLSASIFAIDRLTKWLIESRFSPFDSVTVIPGFFDIVHTTNRGAAFGLFAESSSSVRSFVLIGLALGALVLVAGMLWRMSGVGRATAYGLALILGGALGNLFDRIATGAVTDFLDFYVGALHWPAFNVADSSIVVGSALLLFDLLKPGREPART